MKRMRHAFRALLCLVFTYHAATAAPPGEEGGKKNVNELSRPAAGLTATISYRVNVACKGASTGAATIEVTGGTGNIYYSWSSGVQGFPSINNVPAGTYTCHVTDDGGNFTDIAVEITEPATAVAVSPAVVNEPCYGDYKGSITLTPSGGTAPYTYKWSDNSNNQKLSNKGVGIYTCTVTDANGCTKSASYNITEPNELTATSSSTNISCFGDASGSATANPAGGTTPYSYAWSPTGGSAKTAVGRLAGDYTCTITDKNSCKVTTSVTISQPATALSATSYGSMVACYGANNGIARATPAGGTPPYTYLWSPSGGTAATATGLGPGLYTCTITDANSCTTTTSYNVAQSAAPLDGTINGTSVSCYGGLNGTASVTARGGTPYYTYMWKPYGGTASIAKFLAAGDYTCTITDANGCTKTLSYTVTQPAPLTAGVSGTDVLCNGTASGTATATVNGGAPPYAYAWASAGGTNAIARDLIAGTYSCTITDANGCSITPNSINITEPAPLTATASGTNISCFDGNNGTATITPGGGAGGYTYLWSNGATTATATDLTIGLYGCSVTDVNGCTASAYVDLSQPSAINVTTSKTDVSCNGGNNGTATATATGGAGNFTYLWSNGATTATASNLPAGIYSCKVTDANGCSKTTSNITIDQPAALAVTISGTNVTCNASATGTATVTVSGGTTPYTYLWSLSAGRNATAQYLTAGTYSCTITDANGCSITSDGIYISQPEPLTATASSTNVSCFGGNNGTATVIPAGGVGGYTYLWSNGTTAATATNLINGLYSCSVFDANGCKVSVNVGLSEPSAINVITSKTDATCNGSNNGTVTAAATGGTGALAYLWSNGATTATASSLPAGTYSVKVTDANTCSKTINNISIDQPAALAANISGTNVTCNGGSNGTATVTVSGGTPAYSYTWAPSGGTLATATGLTAGTYTCTITDANNCSTTATYEVTQPSILTATATGTNVNCNGARNGTATVTANGGAGGYYYSWSPSGGNNATATGLTAGTYICTITDANSCSTNATYVVTQPTILTATTIGTNVSCNGGSNGTATVIPAGGAGGYTYQWSSSGGTASTASGLTAGTYTCIVTDANGCTNNDASINISQPAVLTVSVTGTDPSGTLPNGTAAASVAGGTSPYGYSWIPSGAITQTITGLSGGLFTCNVTDANGCQIQGSVQLGMPVTLTGFNNITATYGDASFKLKAPGSNSNGTFTYTSSNPAVASITGDVVTILKTGNTTITASQAANGSYLAGSTTATLTVAPKDISMAVSSSNSITKTYDGTIPVSVAPVNFTLTGVLAGDDITANGTATFDTKKAGTGKTITIAGITLNGTSAGNYQLTTTTLTTTGTILPKPILIAGIPVTKIYDGNTTATVSFLAPGPDEGIVGTDNVAISTATGTFADKNAGTGKTVTISAVSLGGQDANNYQVALPVTVTGTISPKTLAINPVSATKIYGETDQPIVYTTGSAQLVPGDQLSGSLSRNAGENVGVYNVTIGNLNGNGNYNLQLAAATLEIKKAAMVITADDKTIYRGQNIPALTYTITGFVKNETEQVLTTKPVLSANATSSSAAGNYPITIAAATAANYELSFVNGNLKIDATTPTDISLNASTVYENVPVNSLVSSFTTVTPFPTTITYSLVAGAGATDNSSFSISGDKLYTAVLMDYETKAAYSIRVRATNTYGESFEKAFTIQVLDVNEAPTVNPIADVNSCYSKDQQTIAVTGISAGPEAGQLVTLGVTASEDIFSLLKIVAITNSTAEIRYILKDNSILNTSITVTVKDNGGTANGGTDQSSVSFTFHAAKQPIFTLTSDKASPVTSGSPVTLTATGDAATYTWTVDGNTVGNQSTYNAIITRATTFTVNGTLANCSAQQDLTITTTAPLADMLKPTNVITPDGDGYNDKWIVKNIELFPGSEVKIFDRAGRMIFSRRDYRNEWDGTLNGSPLQEGVYLYIIDLKNGSPVQKGYITIVRKK